MHEPSLVGWGFSKPRGLLLDSPTARRSEEAGTRCASCVFKASGRPLRIVYAFDPKRQALLILGGDKTGDDRFYGWMIPKAEGIWEQYLQELR